MLTGFVEGISRWQQPDTGADEETEVAATARIRGGIGADGPFWDALDAGEFRIARCRGCNEWLMPAHFRCGTCGSWDIGWDEVEAAGIIYAWTRNHAVSDVLKERRGDLPYVTVLVELPQAGGARLPGVLVGDPPNLRIGARVRGTIRPPEERSRGYATMVWQIEDDSAPATRVGETEA